MLEQLVGDHRVARFGAGVDRIEHVRFIGEIVAEPVEMLVPIGIFDDDLGARILLFRRAKHEVARRLAHLRQPVIGPAAIALGRDVGVGLHRVEEEVVEDHLVEMARDQPHRAFAFGAVGGVLVIEGAELSAGPAARGERDPARGLDALRLELALDGIQLGIGRELPAAVSLDIDLVELELRRHAGEFPLESGRVGEAFRAADRHVNRNAEVLVRGGVGLRCRNPDNQNCGEQADDPLQTHMLPPFAVSVPNKRPPLRSKRRHSALAAQLRGGGPSSPGWIL